MENSHWIAKIRIGLVFFVRRDGIKIELLPYCPEKEKESWGSPVSKQHLDVKDNPFEIETPESHWSGNSLFSAGYLPLSLKA